MRHLPARILGAAFAALIFVGAVLADDIALTFRATVLRVVVPPGQELTGADPVGQHLSGRIIVAEVPATRDVEPASGSENTFWKTGIRQITLSGALDASFIGGTLFLRDGRFSIQNTQQYCVACDRSGTAIDTTAKEEGGEGKTYIPYRYLFVSIGPYVGKDGQLDATLEKLIARSREEPVKALIMYVKPGAAKTEPEPGSGPDAVKFVLTLSELQLAAD